MDVNKSFYSAKRAFGFLLAICMTLSYSLSAKAEDSSKSPWTYWLGGGAYFLEGNEANKSGQLYEARIGYDIDQNFTVEWGIGGGPFFEENNYNAPNAREATYSGRNAPGENWVARTNVGMLYHLDGSADRKIDPYLSVMGGMSFWGKIREDDNWHPYGGPGAGVSYWFNDDLAVRGDYSMVWTEDGDSKINHQALLMLFYRFGDFFSSSSGSKDAGDKSGVGPDDLGANTSMGLKPVYFDFDKSELKAEAQNTLKENAEWIKKNPAKVVSLEGHCDERGTVEYNLALGTRRAKAAQDYLRSIGVPSERLTTISFGEEFPADPGHNEAAWAKNRRVESVAK